MKKKIVAMVLAFLPMIATVAAIANATQWTVGVKAGDWAVYSFDGNKGTFIWNETVKVEVTSVVGTRIYYSLTWDPPVSDTHDPQLNLAFSNTGSIDVQTGESSGSNEEYFIAVNGSGTTIGSTDYSFTGSTPRQYLGQTLWVTHVGGRGTGIQEDLYWIKSSGVLTELEISGNGFSMTMHTTSASAIPEFTTTLLLFVLIATTLSATMVLQRKKPKRTANP